MNIFEEEVKNILQSKGFNIKNKPKYVDLIIEKQGIKIAVEIKGENDLTSMLPKAFGQLIAAKHIYKPRELWLILKTKDLHNPTYFKILTENEIRIFTIENTNIVEIKSMTPKRDRKVRRGFDIGKLTQIWNVLAQNGDWLHVAEISRRTKIDECTVRWYLDHYLKDAINEERIVPTIRLRMVRLKPNIDLNSYIKALNFIKEVKSGQNARKEVY